MDEIDQEFINSITIALKYAGFAFVVIFTFFNWQRLCRIEEMIIRQQQPPATTSPSEREG